MNNFLSFQQAKQRDLLPITGQLIGGLQNHRLVLKLGMMDDPAERIQEKTMLERLNKQKNNIPLGEVYDMQEGQGYYLDIDEEKVAILGEIVKLTKAKIVLSSSHRWDFKEGKENIENLSSKALLYLFDKYNIDIIGITPKVAGGNEKLSSCSWRENEIKEYLNTHKDIESFCIIDDDIEDLETLSNYLVKTNFYQTTEDNGGLQRKHIKNAVNILTVNRTKKR